MSNISIASCVVNGSYAYDFPYSAGEYVCYNDTKKCGAALDPGNLVLGDINGDAPLTGTAPNQTLNAIGFDQTFAYGLHVSFTGSGTSPVVPGYLQALLGTGVRGSGWICKAGGTGQADIAAYGFADPANCGVTTLTPVA